MRTEEEIIEQIREIDKYIEWLNNNNFGIGTAIYEERKKMLKWVIGKRIIERGNADLLKEGKE